MTPVTRKASVGTILMQFGPHPEAVSLIVVDGGQSQARLFGENLLLSVTKISREMI